MSNWERRQADTLEESIGKHIKRNPGLDESNARLIAIQKAVDLAAITVTTTTTDLNFHRTQLCSVCRNFKLYVCDMPEGWSANCAFICANASEFSPL